MANESISKTFGVAAALCVVCAIIVSLSDVALKGMQLKNKQLDKQVNILRAAGLVEQGAKITDEQADELFADAKVLTVDLETGKLCDDVPNGPAPLVKIDKLDDIADLKMIEKYATLYEFDDENGAIKTLVLPIKGTGLWSVLYGFLALNGDLETVAHIVFYDHAETPGLGGEISNPTWTAKWEGKLAVDWNGNPIIRVIKGPVNPDARDANTKVDGISGATLTGKGVTNTVTFWLGDQGYGPFLDELRRAKKAADAAKAKAADDSKENGKDER